MKTQFKMSKQEVRNIKDLKKSAITELFGFSKLNSYYMRLLKYFDGIHRPIVIDEENYVHCGYDQVIHLAAAGIDKVNVVVVTGITDEVSAARLTDFATFFDQKNYTDIAAVHEYLTRLLTETKEGKQWANEIPGKFTRDKISNLLKISTGKLAGIKVLNDKAPELLEDCSKGSANLTDALSQLGKKKPAEGNGRLTMGPSLAPEKPLAAIKLKFVDGDEFDVTIVNKQAKVLKSGYISEVKGSPVPHQSGDIDHPYDFYISKTEYLSITYTTIKKAA